MVAAELRRGGTRVRRAEATKMDLNDEIFESFFACIGSVKEAKVCAIKMFFSSQLKDSQKFSQVSVMKMNSFGWLALQSELTKGDNRLTSLR